MLEGAHLARNDRKLSRLQLSLGKPTLCFEGLQNSATATAKPARPVSSEPHVGRVATGMRVQSNTWLGSARCVCEGGHLLQILRGNVTVVVRIQSTERLLHLRVSLIPGKLFLPQTHKRSSSPNKTSTWSWLDSLAS